MSAARLLLAVATAVGATSCGRHPSGTSGFPSFVVQHISAGGRSPFAIAVADFDGDGRPDLAVSHAGSDTVGLLRATAPGVFSPGPSWRIEGVPRGLAAADLDGDGHADLVVAPAQSSRVAVIFGDRVERLESGISPFDVAIADLDGDGHPDIVVANESNTGGLEGRGQTTVLFGDGRGRFPRRLTLESGTYPAAVKIADLDGDGRLDLAVVNWGSRDLSLFSGRAGGTFAAPAMVPLGGGPAYTLAAGDLDGDGRPDLAVGDANGVVEIVRNQGPGRFTVADRLPVGAGVRSVVAADLDGDGRLDLATADTGAGTVSVVLARPGGGFTEARAVATARRPRTVIAADLDGNGGVDLAVSDADADEVLVLLNRGAAP